MTDRAHRQPIVGAVSRALKIDQVYLAVVDVEDPAGESVYSATGPNGEKLPVVAVDAKDLAALREYAEQETRRTGKSVSIICFTNRTLHETFSPVTTGDNKS